MTTAEFLANLAQVHTAMFGRSGSGKSWFLMLLADELAKNPLAGFTFICPHGTAALIAERLSNPARAAGRTVHLFDFNSGTSFGLNAFETYADSWEERHQAALLWTSSVASFYATAMQNTPRLETTCYVLGMFAAAKQLTLNDLLPAISLAGERVREMLLADFDNPAVRGPLEDLHALAKKNPRQFLELLESFRNRTVRWLGDKRLARLLGKQKGLDAKAVMDAKDIVLIDASALETDDAAFVTTLLFCRYFAAAKRRAPNVSAPHHLIVDEAASGLCTATAQMLDQTRKYALYCLLSLQRIGQLQDKGEFITEAVMVNAPLKIVFNIPEPRSARFLAETLFTPYLKPAWKEGSERPTPVGNELRTVNSRSRAEHHATSIGSATVDMTSRGRASSAASADMTAWSSGLAQGASTSFASTPSDLFGSSSPLSQSIGLNSTHSFSASAGRSSVRASATQSARTRGTTHSLARADGHSIAHGEAETYVTVYQNLPTQMWSFDETLTRLAGEIMSLKPRECFIALPYREPFRTRTKDLPPAYRSAELKQYMLPRFLEAVRANSPYLAPNAQVDAEIDARAQRMLSPPPEPEPDFARPIPNDGDYLDQPNRYASRFWNHSVSHFDREDVPPAPGLRVIEGGVTRGDNTDDR
jgi:hypothetical protein